MEKKFVIEIDDNMSLEELKKNREKTRELLASLEHQILLNQMAKRKHSS